MKSIKNLKTKGLVYLLVGGISLGTLTGCQKEELKTDEFTVSELLDNKKIASDTQMDELINSGKLMYNDELNYVQAAEKLEEYMFLYQQLSDKEKELALALPKEDVIYIKEALMDPENVYNEAEETNFVRFLLYLRSYYYNWIHENGKDISVGIMKAAVKSGLANSLKEDYSSISLSQRRSNNAEPDYGRIKTKSATYDLLDADRDISKVTNYIYDLQMIDKIDSSKEFETYSKSIKYAKEIIATGIVADGDNLEQSRSISDTNKILSK